MLIIVILIVGQGIPGQQPSIQGCQQQLPRYIGSIQDTSQENYLKLNYLWLLSSFLSWDCTHVDLSATQITFMLLSTSWWGTPADFLTSNRISSYFEEMWTIFCMFTLNFQKELKRIRWRCIFRQMGLVGPLVGGVVGGLGLTSASVASALWQRPCYVYTALSGGQSSLDFAFLLCFIKTTKTCNKVKRNYDLGFICVTDITVEYNIFMLPQAACSTPVNWFNLHP